VSPLRPKPCPHCPHPSRGGGRSDRGDWSFLPASNLRTRNHWWPVWSLRSGPNGTTFPRYSLTLGGSCGPGPAARGSTCSCLNRWRLYTSRKNNRGVSLTKVGTVGTKPCPDCPHPLRGGGGKQSQHFHFHRAPSGGLLRVPPLCRGGDLNRVATAILPTL
jgi:hypothetical protein